MKSGYRFSATVIMLALIFTFSSLHAADNQEQGGKNKSMPEFSIGEGMQTTIIEQAGNVSEELARQARSLFDATPLGWDMKTVNDLYSWALRLPSLLPKFLNKIMEQSRTLGMVGSLVVFTFLVTVIYSLIGRKKVLKQIEKMLRPFEQNLPPKLFPYLLSFLKVIVAALIPLTLLGVFSLINAFIAYPATWFQFLGQLLWIWVIGALITGLLRESLTQQLFPRTARYGRKIFNLTRLTLFYVLAGFILIWSAETFNIRPDIVSLIKFVISVSIVIVLFLLHLMKKAFLSLLPDLPYGPYQFFIRQLDRFYYPFIFASFIVALLWCFGYHQLGQVVLLKSWYTVGAFLLIMVIYHNLRGWIEKWYGSKDRFDETVRVVYKSLKSMLFYATAIATTGIVLNLLGWLGPLVQIISFPVAKLGTNDITLWIIVKAMLILMAFVFSIRLLQAYMDYRVYPTLGIDPGLGYAVNISLKYTLLVVGFLISLKAVGIDLRFLLVFAGAAGIGIGLGLQHMAADIISGFSIIFGGRIRKGDWIQVENTLGIVTDIYLGSTRVRTRDNIEFMIPNSSLISNTIVNYTLSSPMIRIDLLVGVAYDADPREVEKILLDAAVADPSVSDHQPPVVRFVEYADNSINFELLFWIDVRETARRKVRSDLYFAIFDALKEAGIQIPYPQRDLHIRSSDLKQLN